MIRKPNQCLLYGSVGESGAMQHDSEAGEYGPSSDAGIDFDLAGAARESCLRPSRNTKGSKYVHLDN